MKMSPQVNELFTALSKAEGAMTAAGFDRVNPHFKNRYASLAATIEAIRKPLADNGLAIAQVMETSENGLCLVTMLTHSSGQWISGDYPLQIAAKPQELGSALTYARRYSLSAIVSIAGDDDDDAEGARKQDQIASSLPLAPTLANKDAKELYAAMQAEIDAMTDYDTLIAWAKNEDNKARKKLLPLNWQAMISSRFLDHQIELRKKIENKAPDHTKDWDGWLRWVDKTCNQLVTIGALETFWNNQVAPITNAALPPDEEGALLIFSRHETRINAIGK